jgi:hypothetical protein
MNTDNRFPLEDCFQAVTKAKRLEDWIEDRITEACAKAVYGVYRDITLEGQGTDPGDEHGAHGTIEEGDEPCR